MPQIPNTLEMRENNKKKYAEKERDHFSKLHLCGITELEASA